MGRRSGDAAAEARDINEARTTTSDAQPVQRSSCRGFLFFLVALTVVAAAFLGKALVGDVFCSTEVVHRSVQPWSGLEPRATLAAPEHNRDLADQPTVWLGMQSATRSMVRAWLAGRGELPLYCEQSYCGAPWLGNMSSALFSPFTWLFVVLPFAPAFAVCAAAKWLLAGVGTWFLARRLGASSWGCALAGCVYAFCGFQVVWIDSCLTNVSVWAPWLLLAVERILKRPSAGRVAALAAASWQVLVGGHPETSFWIALGAGVYSTVRWLGTKERMERRLAKLGALLAGAALGGALSIVQWWPFLEYALHSYGNWLREHTPNLLRSTSDGVLDRGSWTNVVGLVVLLVTTWLTRGGPATRAGKVVVPAFVAILCVAAGATLRWDAPSSVMLGLLPDWFGRPLDGGSYGGPLTYNDVTAGFVGAALLVGAIAVAVTRFTESRVLALVLAALPLVSRLARVAPLNDLFDHAKSVAHLGPTRALAMLALIGALLGGFALDELRERPKRFACGVVGALLFVLGFVVASPCAIVSSSTLDFTRVAGTRLELPRDLARPDASDATSGALIRGLAPPDAERVKIAVNGFELGEVATRPPPTSAPSTQPRPFEWRWLGSERLEEASYLVVAEAVRADGSTQRFQWASASVVRPARPSARWAVHLGAIAVLLGAALFVGSARARVATLVVVTLVELLFFGVNYDQTTPRERLPSAANAPAPIPLLQQKRRELGPLRVFTARTHLHPNLHLLFADPPIDVLRGYDALEPVDYVHVLNELYRDHREVAWTQLDFATLDFEGPRGALLADFLNVRFALSEEPPPKGWREVWRQTPVDPTRAPLVLYENPNALPRAFVVQRGLAYRDDFAADPRTVAVWDRDRGDGPAFAGAAKLVALDDRPGRLHATVESDAGTILIVSENVLLDGSGGRSDWRATIDGSPAEIRRTHGSFLSVVVPTSGRHEVELVYRPRSVVLGALASSGALASWLVLALASLLARRRGAARSRSSD